MKSPDCLFIPNPIRKELNDPKQSNYQVPEEADKKFRNIIDQYNLYQSENILYKIGIYQFLEIYNEFQFIPLLIDFDTSPDSSKYSYQAQNSETPTRLIPEFGEFFPVIKLPTMVPLKLSFKLILKNFWIPNKQIFFEMKNKETHLELDREIFKSVLFQEKATAKNFVLQRNLTLDDFDANGNYPQGNFLMTQNHSGSIFYDVEYIESIYVRSMKDSRGHAYIGCSKNQTEVKKCGFERISTRWVKV